jgi:hypothetical protein
MQLKLLIAVILATSITLPVFSQSAQQRYQRLDKGQSCSQIPSPAAGGLPLCVHGPAVGPPGDGVSQGQFYSGGGNYSQAQRGTSGLPKCLTSKFMGPMGDGIRSDLGHQISGAAGSTSAVRRQPGAVGLPKCLTSKYMGPMGDGIRSDLGHQISGAAAQQRQVVNNQQRVVQQAATQQPVMTYKDYTH